MRFNTIIAVVLGLGVGMAAMLTLILITHDTYTEPTTLDFVYPVDNDTLLVQFNTTDGKFVAIYGEMMVEQHLGLKPSEYTHEVDNRTKWHLRWLLKVRKDEQLT